MRAYRIERSTMAWNHILRQIENGNQPIHKAELAHGRTMLDKFVADIKQALEHDDNHYHNRGVELPEGMSNSNDPVVPYQRLRDLEKEVHHGE